MGHKKGILNLVSEPWEIGHQSNDRSYYPLRVYERPGGSSTLDPRELPS